MGRRLSGGDDTKTVREWHRVDAGRGMRRVLTLAVVMVALGALGVGGTFVSRFSQSLGHGVALLGACIMFAGLLLSVSTAVQLVRIDRYCALRLEGLLLHFDRDKELEIAWDAITKIEARPDGVVVFTVVRDSAETREEWDVGSTSGAKALAARLESLRPKAAHGLLKDRDFR